MDQLIRVVRKIRGAYIQEFKFTTYDVILKKEILEKPEEDKNDFDKLITWLNHAFFKGLPNLDGYESCSSALTPQPAKIEKIKTELPEMAQLSDYKWKRAFQHIQVQDYFLKNDKHTIAIEMPLWLSPAQSPNGKGWHGSVDIVRVVNGRIQLADFKPDAETTNHTRIGPQQYRYAYMLHRVAKIPLQDIDLLFFDSKNTYKITI